ncbi:MAG: 4-amino-4-deoxychorismate lyase [Pseudonocardiales bacterium]|nr:4-amino-4-deoxychorismate lyase [Pseudonocardiales bacterium]
MTVRLLGVLGTGLVDRDRPVLHADDLGLTRGDGCFEGCRIVTTAAGVSAVDKLGAHLARMARSAEALELPFEAAAWRSLVGQACAAWREQGEAAMKLILTRGTVDGGPPVGLLTVSRLPQDYPRQRRDGLRVVTLSRGMAADAFTDAPWLLGGVKTLSYAVNMAAQREAQRRGADDVIFVSSDGQVLESPTSSVVWSVGRTLYSPPPGANGILGGTTQQLLFARAALAGWGTAGSSAAVADLHAADALWLIGSVRGPVDVVALDGKDRSRDATLNAEIRRLAGFG